MKLSSFCAAAALATALVGSPALAADTNANATTQAGQKTADKDFGKLSVDGVKAFRDVQAARLAIFNGEPDRAKTYLADAQGALGRAKGDDTVFMKAEAELKTAPGDKQSEGATSDQAKAKVAWIPVDGQMAVDEDYTDSSAKTAEAAKPDAKDQGSKATAGRSDPLKLADLDVDFTAEVLPLQATIGQVNDAAELAGQNKFYEASLKLKAVEDSARFDTVVVNATPSKSNGSPSPS